MLFQLLLPTSFIAAQFFWGHIWWILAQRMDFHSEETLIQLHRARIPESHLSPIKVRDRSRWWRWAGKFRQASSEKKLLAGTIPRRFFLNSPEVTAVQRCTGKYNIYCYNELFFFLKKIFLNKLVRTLANVSETAALPARTSAFISIITWNIEK